jgi:pimeloyl-ACP methyl ester carboxylesterase
VISGYSMGGWASGKLAFEHPDDFAGALVLDGPIACGVEDRFSDVVSALGSPVRRTDPGSFTDRWYPSPDNATLGIGATGDYWLSGLSARDKAYGKLATVVADDAALPDPVVSLQRFGPSPTTQPLPGTNYGHSWKLGSPVAGRSPL